MQICMHPTLEPLNTDRSEERNRQQNSNSRGLQQWMDHTDIKETLDMSYTLGQIDLTDIYRHSIQQEQNIYSSQK